MTQNNVNAILLEIATVKTDKDFYRVVNSINENPNYSVDEINHAREVAEFNSSSQFMGTFLDCKNSLGHHVTCDKMGSFHQVQYVEWDGKIYKQYFNDCLEFEEYIETTYDSWQDTLPDIKKNAIKGMSCNVLKSHFSDCTNGGISSKHDELYIIYKDGFHTPKYLTQCVQLKSKAGYKSVKPIYRIDKWHMMGGNFIYSTDSRFEEVTGTSQPIAIHDRVEG